MRPIEQFVAALLIGCNPSPNVLRPLTDASFLEAVPAKHQHSTHKAPRRAKVFRLFTIDSVRNEGTYIRVAGFTDLPDGTGVDVDLESTRVVDCVRGSSEVRKGKWHVDLDAPVAPVFYKETHAITASGMLEDDRKGKVGPRISDGDSDLGFEAHVKRKVQGRPRASFGGASATLPRPDHYPADRPGRVLALVIQDWKRHDWHDMARWVHAMHENAVAKRTKPTDPKFDMSNGDNMFDESSFVDRVEACKSQFRSWEVREARIGEVNVGADPQAPIDNAQATVHLKTTFAGKEKDLDVIWVLFWCKGEHSKDHWGVDIYSVRPVPAVGKAGRLSPLR